MFVIVGHRVRTESFAGAESRTLVCKRCSAHRLHHEKRVVQTATLFFVEAVNLKQHHIWECEGCGSQVARPETVKWLADQGDTAFGKLTSLVEEGIARGGALVEEGLAAGGDFLQSTFDNLSEQPSPPRASEAPPPAAEPEPEESEEPADRPASPPPFKRRRL